MHFPPQGHRPAPSWSPDNVAGYQTTQRFKRHCSLTGAVNDAYAIEHYRSSVLRAITRPLLIVGALALIVVVVKQAGVLL